MYTKIIPYELYTDGSCKKSGLMTFGGWSFILVQDGKIITHGYDAEPDTTNQRMELTAVIKGIEVAQQYKKSDERIRVYSDSAYLINCCNQNWYKAWLNNGWKNSKKQPVANEDLWKQLIDYFDSLDYEFYKVNGHAGHSLNEMCDKYAQEAAQRLKENWKGYDS